MSDPALWSHQYTSGQSSSTFAFPSDAQWFQAVGPGTVVLEMAGGVTFTRTCVGGEVYPGTYLSLTSTTCTYVVLGNGPIPPAVSPSGTAAGVTVADVGGFFTGTTAEAVLAEIGQSLESALGVIPLPPPATWSLLADGAPMAVWSNATTTTPGTYSDGAKIGGSARWNNDAAPAAIVTKFDVPPDMDITANAVVHFRVAKTGATNNAGNTTTITAIAANQVDGALYDADTNFGGVSSALLPAATAKTIQNLTLTLALADLAAYPASVTLSAKPTAGTLDTDDLVFLDAYVVYKKKLLTS